MSEHELEKLLGGFATDTLTPEERETLYRAALQDQELFNVLADEQAMKELLADPVVRRRLLLALNQSAASNSGTSLSWLDWFRRPANLALTGGVAVAVVAVILGTKVYQEGLRQAARTTATEETIPATPLPSTSQPTPSDLVGAQQEAKERSTPLTDLATQETRADKLTDQKQSAPSKTQEPSAADTTMNLAKLPSKPSEAGQQAEPSAGKHDNKTKQAAASADMKREADDASPDSTPELSMLEAPVGRVSGAIPSATGARALFYGSGTARQDPGMMTQEKQRAPKLFADSGPRTERLERKTEDEFTTGRRAEGLVTPAQPLGLRYSFLLRGSDGRDQEVLAATPGAGDSESVRLTVETNQDSYVQIWKTGGHSTPRLLFPAKESGQISRKILGGERQHVPLPQESGSVTVRLSRVPFGPVTRQEAALFDQSSPNLLEEAVTASTSTTRPEEATYVVNRNPTAADLMVAIPFDLTR